MNKRLSDLETGHLLRGNNFVVGDVFVSLVCTHNKVLALAFICSTHILQGGSARGHIKTATLMSPQGRIKVTGDIMVLRPSITSPVLSPKSLWLWTGSYLKAASSVPGMQVKTTHIVSMSVAGHLLTVVNPTTATASAHLAPDDQAEVNANDTTWALSTKALETAMAMIWGQVAAHKTPLSGFPLIGHTCNLFPYQTLDGMSVNSMGDHDTNRINTKVSNNLFAMQGWNFLLPPKGSQPLVCARFAMKRLSLISAHTWVDIFCMLPVKYLKLS